MQVLKGKCKFAFFMHQSLFFENVDPYYVNSFAPTKIVYHTIYKYNFVRCFWAAFGCVRVCNTSLELPSHPHERMPTIHDLSFNVGNDLNNT